LCCLQEELFSSNTFLTNINDQKQELTDFVTVSIYLEKDRENGTKMTTATHVKVTILNRRGWP
jgi:hypothetical protein